jgi:hypothetical protein
MFFLNQVNHHFIVSIVFASNDENDGKGTATFGMAVGPKKPSMHRATSTHSPVSCAMPIESP